MHNPIIIPDYKFSSDFIMSELENICGYNVLDSIIFGVDLAIVIHALEIILEIEAKDPSSIRDNCVWHRGTYSQIRQWFPYWKEEKVGRLFNTLVKNHIISKRNFDGLYRVNAYTINKDNLQNRRNKFRKEIISREKNIP